MSKGWPYYVVGVLAFGTFFLEIAGLLLDRVHVNALLGFAIAILCALVGLAAMIQGDIRADKG